MKNILAATILAAAAATGTAAAADAPADIGLPKPAVTGGMPLLDALSARKSGRAFADKDLAPQILSDLLWATCGINREDGRRTSPTARNWQEIDVYVVLKDGTYLYDPKSNTLVGKLAGDNRAKTGVQPFAATAPVNLVFVADTAKMGGGGKADIDLYSATDAAFASQNTYLFCASAGLATVVRGAIDRGAIAKMLGLPETSRVILAQSIGYPAE